MKKLRQYFAIFLVIVSITTGATTPVQAISGSTTVYITKTGKCYHRSDCHTINRNGKHRKGVKKVTLKKAVGQGLRECKICKPGKLTKSNGSGTTRGSTNGSGSNYLTTPKKGFKLSKTVYVSKSGKIHKKSNCSGMKNYTPMTYEEACQEGYKHCKKCFRSGK